MVTPGVSNLFLQLVSARYEKGAMIARLGRGVRRSCRATALLDRLLHHAVVIQIEGLSYRLYQHAAEHIRPNPTRTTAETAQSPAPKEHRRITITLITDPTQPVRLGKLQIHIRGNFGDY